MPNSKSPASASKIKVEDPPAIQIEAPPPLHRRPSSPGASPPSQLPGTSQTQKSTTIFFKRDGLLIIIGALLICSMILSLCIGNYHHNQYANDFLSMASPSVLQSKLREFVGEEGAVGKPKDKQYQHQAQHQQIQKQKQQETIDSNHERSIFESIIKRAKWTRDQCNNLPVDERNTVKKELKIATDLPMLPEGGVASALEKWMSDNPLSSSSSTNYNNDYPTCYLPPAKSCNVTTYTLVIMSHTTERLQTFMDPLGSMVDSWPGLTEIIIVWNSPRSTLTDGAAGKPMDSKQQSYATKLLQWDEDSSHPLRIFFSLEEGLANNLLNRYHPKLKPKNEVVMYFDDDGPFWSKEAMVYGGFELWKRNSNVQVGGFPRNIRFLSDRMKSLERANLQRGIDIVAEDADGYVGVDHPPFTPLCRNTARDHVEYNYFSFPDFAGHVLLPSGTFLHRNFLCFIWHPAFAELRQWVVTHKTMPDDMTVSTLISHLSGRAPRTFPREISNTRHTGRRRRLSSANYVMEDRAVLQNETSFFDQNRFTQSPQYPESSHRRLLWKQKNWGGMREEAINSILGYFGSIHPGTVGWCASTPHQKKNHRGVPFVCHPEKPSLNLIPWLNEGGVGSTQCPLLDPAIIEQHVQDDPLEKFDDLCFDCKYKGMNISCRKRVEFLVSKYDISALEAKTAVIKEDPGCKRTRK